MKMNVWLGIAAAGAALGAAALGRAQSAPPAGVPDNVVRLTVVQDDDAEAKKTQTLPASDYWIGIALGELPEIARQQLKLESGLVVAEVLPDSPAAKAEFKTNDILIKAGDARLAAAADLIKAVDATKEKELAIVVVRGGDERTIKVTPIKRPKSETAEEQQTFSLQLPSPDIKADIKKLEEALSKLKEKTGSAPLGLMLARPAVVPPTAAGVHVDVLKAAELPKNVTIQITKKGDQPARIRVTKDDKSWEVTEGKLEDLPEDIRGHVQQMLGQRVRFRTPTAALPALPGARFEYRLAPATPVAPAAPVPPVAARSPVPAAPPIPAPPPVARLHTYRVEAGGNGAEGKLDAILKKLEQLESRSVERLEKEVKQLRQELDELRKKSPGERE